MKRQVAVSPANVTGRSGLDKGSWTAVEEHMSARRRSKSNKSGSRKNDRQQSGAPSSRSSERDSKTTGSNLDGSCHENDKVVKPKTHLLVLMHGFLGSAADFINFKKTVEGSSHGDEFVVLVVSRNGGWTGTLDGVSNGARRAFEEVMICVAQHEDTLESISICGHSLGGLYARYLAHLLDREGVLDRLQPVVFATLATPHLGVRKPQNVPFNVCFHMLLPIIKTTSELGLMDNDKLLYRMATEDSFLDPLRKFHKKALYANVFNDVNVSYQTAAIRTRNPYTSRKVPVAVQTPGGESIVVPEAKKQEPRKWWAAWVPDSFVLHARPPHAADNSHSSEYPHITKWSINNSDKRKSWETARHIEPGVVAPHNSSNTASTNRTQEVQQGYQTSGTAAHVWDPYTSFRHDAKCDLLRNMIFHLDVKLSNWERYDVSFIGPFAHEQIVNKKACLSGKTVVMHFVDKVLIPAHVSQKNKTVQVTSDRFANL